MYGASFLKLVDDGRKGDWSRSDMRHWSSRLEKCQYRNSYKLRNFSKFKFLKSKASKFWNSKLRFRTNIDAPPQKIVFWKKLSPKTRSFTFLVFTISLRCIHEEWMQKCCKGTLADSKYIRFRRVLEIFGEKFFEVNVSDLCSFSACFKK